MHLEIINPFVGATVLLFERMLQCRLTRGEPQLVPAVQHYQGVTGLIDLEGGVCGRVVLNLSRTVALSGTTAWTGDTVSVINSEVVDTVGEMVSIITGQARARIEHLPVTMSLPKVLKTPTHRVEFHGTRQALRIPFHSIWGTLFVDIGISQTAPVSASI